MISTQQAESKGIHSMFKCTAWISVIMINIYKLQLIYLYYLFEFDRFVESVMCRPAPLTGVSVFQPACLTLYCSLEAQTHQTDIKELMVTKANIALPQVACVSLKKLRLNTL